MSRLPALLLGLPPRIGWNGIAIVTSARRRVFRADIVAQLARFGTVGISNTLLAFAIFTLLVKAFQTPYLLASAIGFVVGAINGYVLNRRWTFRAHDGDALTPIRWTIVQGLGLGLDELLLYCLVRGAGLEKLLAQALTIVVVVLLTFYANRTWTFPVRGAQGLGRHAG